MSTYMYVIICIYDWGASPYTYLRRCQNHSLNHVYKSAKSSLSSLRLKPLTNEKPVETPQMDPTLNKP